MCNIDDHYLNPSPVVPAYMQDNMQISLLHIRKLQSFITQCFMALFYIQVPRETSQFIRVTSTIRTLKQN